MPTLGPLAFTAFSSEPVPAGLPWPAPSNAASSDDVATFIDFTLGVSDEVSEDLRGVEAPFEVDLDATVNEVQIFIERSEVGSDVRDAVVRLVYLGAPIGDNKADATEWPPADAVATYTWTEQELADAGVTPAVVNDPTFGAQLRITSMSGTGPRGRVDAITASVTFTAAPGQGAVISNPLGPYTQERIADQRAYWGGRKDHK